MTPRKKTSAFLLSRYFRHLSCSCINILVTTKFNMTSTMEIFLKNKGFVLHFEYTFMLYLQIFFKLNLVERTLVIYYYF